jgi:hypothetical protein
MPALTCGDGEPHALATSASANRRVIEFILDKMALTADSASLILRECVPPR